MIEYEELSKGEQHRVCKLAWNWYTEQAEHVDALMKCHDKRIAPSGSDLFHPELWKAIHWNWYMRLVDDNEKESK